jgi:hypothetical protein
MPTNHYDVILLGDDPAGLIAATLCARRGLRVLIAETAATVPSEYKLGAFTLPRRLSPFVGETSPAVRRVIGELNFIQLLRRRLQPLKPAFQVVLPDARVEVGADADVLGRELGRELPDERPSIEGFLTRATEVSRVLEPVLGQDVAFPPDGFWERREIGRNETRLPAPEEELLPGVGARARALVTLPAAFSLPCDPRALTPTAIARAFDLWRRGAARLEGGPDTLRGLLLDKLRTQHAGEVRVARPTSVTTKWGRATAVTLTERAETIGCGHLLVGAPPSLLEPLFGEKPPRRLVALARAIRPTAHRFVLNVVLSGAGVPEGISPVTFVVADPEADLVGANAFAIHLGEPDDEGRVVVSIVAHAPAPDDDRPAALQASIAALQGPLLARLEEVMPFSSEHIVLVHCPSLPGETDAPPPTAPEPLYTASLPLSLGVGALPYDVGVKGVTSASALNLLGLGLEGAFAAGWCAARAVCAAAGKKRDYLKDEVLFGTS